MPVRGAVLEAVGEPVVVADLDLIEPRAGEVRVRMLASGVCPPICTCATASGTAPLPS